MCQFVDHVRWKAIQSIVYLMISITVLLYGNNILNNQRAALEVQSNALGNILVVQTQVKDMIKTQQFLVAQQELRQQRLHDLINMQVRPATVTPKLDKLLDNPIDTAKEKK